MRKRVVHASLIAATAVTALVVGATPASAVSVWPIPTVWCQYRVTSTSGANERWGPGKSYMTDGPGFAYQQIITAGADWTVYNGADHYTWRRLDDTRGQNQDGGYVAASLVTRTAGGCVTS